jgi:uncharacterized protein (TIGR01777 family)
MTTSQSQPREPGTRKTVAISGSSGLIGSALRKRLAERGYEIKRMVRRRSASSRDEIAWSPEDNEMDATQLEGVDAIVNLAGESLAQRWTERVKHRLWESRIRSTELLARSIATLTVKPAALLSGSAIGIYGDRGDEQLDEASLPGDGFLAELCCDWEAAAAPVERSGVRVVNLRTGIVLSRAGGALAQMLTPFRFGVGGKLGSGKQWMSWISLADVVSALEFLMGADISGPVNLVAPNPVTNEQFTRALANELHRPSLFTVPRFAMKLAFGEMADEAALASQRVAPRQLLESRFTFAHPTVEQALASVLS